MMAIYELSASDTLISDPAPAIHNARIDVYESAIISDLATNYRLTGIESFTVSEEIVLSNDKTLSVTDSVRVDDVSRRVKLCDAVDSIAPSETSGRAEIESDDLLTGTEVASNVKSQPAKDTSLLSEVITIHSVKTLSLTDGVSVGEGATHYSLKYTKVYHPT